MHQGLLIKHLKSIFPVEETLVNVRKQSNMKYQNSRNNLELDVWIPERNICFEFQDAYHYVATWYYHRSLAKIQFKDNAKRDATRKKRITLVEVPCWWDGDLASLMASINFQRPDMAYAQPMPIALNPGSSSFEFAEIPNIGQLMLASFPVDKNFSYSVSQGSWWMGEKYDGVRCCWHPEDHLLYSRNGNTLPLPMNVARHLPATNFLDGEIWFGRGQFSQTYSVVSSSENAQWALVRVLCFDTPSHNLSQEPFEERYKVILDYLPIDNPVTILASRMLCKNRAHMNYSVQGIIDEGGEGAILRKVGSYYDRGRSPDLVKLKVANADMEGIVKKINDDKSVSLKLPNGITVQVPPNSIRIPTPAIGDIVSFSYESHTRREEPVNPIIYRVRKDLTWDDVVLNSAQEQKILTDDSKVESGTAQPIGHWDADNMRAFLEKIAKARNLDPLSAETWYNIPKSVIYKKRGGRTILRKLKGHFNALCFLFPDVKLDIVAFQRSKWQEIENRRKFFENYAKAKGFDPQNPENWYLQPRKSIVSFKGAGSVIKTSVANTLMDLFPNIGLQRSKFPYIVSRKSKYRNFFERFAKLHNFDPTNPKNWYSQTKAKIFAMKGGRVILAKYRNSVSKALMAAFPDIGLDKSLFDVRKTKWDEKSSNFFVLYARQHGFDPLCAENWYHQPTSRIMSFAETRRIVRHFNGSVPQALIALFPNIGLEKWKFWATDAHNRQKIFERFAEKNTFDSRTAENWHTQSLASIMQFEGVADVVRHHEGSVAQALHDLFPDIGLNLKILLAKEAENSIGTI